jgi:CheY-like chemotaxis protein
MAASAGATILLADDEPAARLLIETALAAEGYRVLAAKDGYEALQVFDERCADIDLVITDMCMPYIGGSELIAALQARRASLKCLCITAYAADRELGLPLLKKPFTRTELLRTVHDVLD